MKALAQQLIFDAVIGHQMVEAVLEEQTTKCEQAFADAYNLVLAGIREARSSNYEVATTLRGALPPDNQELQEQRIIEEVEALLGGKECADEMLRLEIVDEFRALYLDLQDDQQQFKRDFLDAASAPDAAGSATAATSKSGGWVDADDERFVKVLKSHERKGGSAKKPELLYEQLQHVLPHMSAKELKKHMKFHHHLRFYQDKCRDRQKEFERRRAEVRSRAQEKLQLALRVEKDKQAQLEQLQVLQKNCEKLHGKVAEWKVSKEAQDRIALQQQAIEQLLAAQKQEEDEMQLRRRHEKQRRLVEDYRSACAVEWCALGSV